MFNLLKVTAMIVIAVFLLSFTTTNSTQEAPAAAAAEAQSLHGLVGSWKYENADGSTGCLVFVYANDDGTYDVEVIEDVNNPPGEFFEGNDITLARSATGHYYCVLTDGMGVGHDFTFFPWTKSTEDGDIDVVTVTQQGQDSITCERQT